MNQTADLSNILSVSCQTKARSDHRISLSLLLYSTPDIYTAKHTFEKTMRHADLSTWKLCKFSRIRLLMARASLQKPSANFFPVTSKRWSLEHIGRKQHPSAWHDKIAYDINMALPTIWTCCAQGNGWQSRYNLYNAELKQASVRRASQSELHMSQIYSVGITYSSVR